MLSVCWNKSKTVFFYVLFGIALTFLLEFVAQTNPNPIDFFNNFPKAAAATVLATLAILVFLDALLGRRYLSFIPVFVLFGFLAWASREKLRYLTEPLYPSDLVFVGQVMDLLPELMKSRPWTSLALGLGAVVMVAAIVLTVRRISLPDRMKIGSRLISGIVGLAGIVFFGYLLSPGGGPVLNRYTGMGRIVWLPMEHYRRNGFLLGFTLDMDLLRVSVPAIHGDPRLLEIATEAAKKTAPETSARKYDIVMVMSEAFWDPSKLPNVHISPDPMPTVRKFEVGEMFSPSLGGGTANVEFEALTGFSNAFLPPGSVPYQHFLHSQTPSLAWALKDKGYRTLAIHPYHKWFWNRENVYRYLGFDNFLTLGDMPDIPMRGPFASDTALSDKIIEQLSRADDPLFLFAVTVQNHGPYGDKRYSSYQDQVKFDVDVGDPHALQTYAEGVAEADDGLRKLVDWLKKRDRPTLLVFFGDHLPYLGNNLLVYDKSGYVDVDDGLSIDEFARMRETPLVMWSNKSDQMEKTGALSPCLISNLIFNYLGITHPYYSGFLNEVGASFRVIERRAVLDGQGTWHDNWFGHADKRLKEFHAIEYDNLFGDKVSRPILFPELDRMDR